MMIRYLIEKEFKQLVRNPFLPKLILIFPCMMMLLMPWAANLEVKDIRLAVVDADHSQLSRRLLEKVSSSVDYFRTVAFPGTWNEALRCVESGQADAILEIPRGFERQCMRGAESPVLIAVNAVNGTKGGLAGSYLTTVLSSVQPGVPPVGVETQYLFNPSLDYKHFIVPALMVMLLTLLCGFLPSLNVVGEKEAGTIEQINVTPVRKFVFILAKLVPYWLIGFVVLTLCFVLAWMLYSVVPVGSFLTIYGFALVFLVVVSGFGLVISNYSDTLQQAMFVMFFFLLLFILMSGLFTPIRSMPLWAQAITWVNPLRYFVEVMRAVYLRGSGVADLLPQLGALAGFAVVFNLWAVRSYRKRA